MNDSAYITRRLHVSGLTPQISAADIKTRLGTFGNVKDVDGLGKRDALGQPRPFAYVTLETTKQQLSKCLNLLSGTTWKGAKLRIGEARPDFRERIRKENEADNNISSRPNKRRRLARGTEGVHAPNMSPVTSTSLRPGWRVTPLGRLVRPMRMRPLRPLRAKHSSIATTGNGAREEKKTRKKRNVVLVRARRRKIDPVEWGSTYLSGIMLESGSGTILPERSAGLETNGVKVARNGNRVDEAPEKSSGTRDGGPTDDSRSRSTSASRAPSESYPDSTTRKAVADLAVEEVSSFVSQAETETGQGLAEERVRSLALLNSLFGTPGTRPDADDEDWGSAESITDIDMDTATLAVETKERDGENDDIEYVPRNVSIRAVKEAAERKETDALEAGWGEPDRKLPAKEIVQERTEHQQPAEAKVQMTKLKDMFAPRPEDTGFSILDNLDLDFELDDDVLPTSAPPAPQVLQAETSHSFPITVPASRYSSATTLDPKQPFFFPHSLSPQSPLHLKPGDPRDIFSKAVEFYRTESEEEIRRRWEAHKGDLTREWKRRHREAVKSARRRGGAQD